MRNGLGLQRISTVLSVRNAGTAPAMATALRPLLAVVLAAAEMLTTSVLFVFDKPLPGSANPVLWVRQLVLLALFAAVAWVVIGWPRRREIIAAWRRHADPSGWGLPLACNVVFFAVLTAATLAFSARAALLDTFPLGWFALYCVPLLATGLSLTWLMAPAAFWRTLVAGHAVELGVAGATAAVVLAVGTLARQGWSALSGLTLDLVAHLLVLFAQPVFVDPSRALIGIGDFAVTVDESCSGYEGMGLVTVFLALFLWAFRATLRFPQAFLLLPIGLAAILLLNVVRIAALVAMGAHLSPAVAVDGFHSQAGWMAFLVVTIGIMTLALRLPYFSTTRDAARQGIRDNAPESAHTGIAGDRQLEAYLVPFMALMAGSILVAASAPYDNWLYGVKIVLAGAALWAFRAHYRSLAGPVDPLALAVGLAIAVAWIATDPGLPADTAGKPGLAAWIAAQPLWIVAAWLVVRAIGTIIVVPIVEELAFRGALYRWIISRRIEAVPFDRLSWLALAISSALFGLLHSRPLAGALAGAAFALLMVRRGRLMDAIVAHTAANAAIIAWAILARQWTLL